jgi:glycosyltransferase involved in cell wall biosynthesis
VGTLEPRKNVGGLLDAYERLLEDVPDAPDLVLVGRATRAAAPWLERVKRPPLAGRARHLGYVPDEARRPLYEEARVLVLPSFNEGFGLPVLEAMTVGVPVVASTRGALPEVLGDAGLLVDPEDVNGLADAMARLLRDNTLAAQCAARGVRRALGFNWRASAVALRDAYEHAIAFRRHRQVALMRAR